jgi:uncharacterized Zn-binding protein involved in type VI secretion
MKNVAIIGTDRAGGTIIGGTQTKLCVTSIPVAVVGDPVASHGDSPHGRTRITEGSSKLRVNGIPVAGTGDKAACGHTVVGTSKLRVSD